jgi:hypothetical protein
MLRRSVLIRMMLRDVQTDIESRCVSEAVKRRQRAMLRGFRAGFETMTERLSMEDVERALRLELGLPIDTVPVGTTTEDE